MTTEEKHKLFKRKMYQSITVLEKSIMTYHKALREGGVSEVYVDQLDQLRRKLIDLNMFAIELYPPNDIIINLMTMISKMYPAIYLSDQEEVSEVLEALGRMELNQQMDNRSLGPEFN